MRALFSPPQYSEELPARSARLLISIVWILMAAVTIDSLIGVFSFASNPVSWLALTGGMDVIGLILIGLVHYRFLRVASLLLVGVTWVVVTLLGISFGGLRPWNILAYVLIASIAGMVLGEVNGVVVGVICSLTSLELALAEKGGLLSVNIPISNMLSLWMSGVLLTAVILGIQTEASRLVRGALKQAQQELDERKRMEVDLLQAKEYAESLIRTANAMVVGMDLQGNITIYNQAAEKVIGYTQDEVLRTNWFDRICPLDRYPDVWAEFQRLKSGGFPCNYESVVLTKTRDERTIVWQNNVLQEHGKPSGIISFGIDITGRKQAEARLRESEERFRRLVDSMDDWVFTLDCADRYTGVYGNLYGLGFQPDQLTEFIGKAAVEVVGQEAAAAHQEAHRRALLGENVMYEWSMEVNGKRRQIQTKLSPMRNEHGDVVGAVGLGRDVTEMKRSEGERRIAQAQKEVQHLLMDQREKERLQIAHDLHDGPIQDLVGVTLALQGVLIDTFDMRTAVTLQSVQQMLLDLITSLRSFTSELRPSTLMKFGLANAIRDHLEGFQKKHPDIEVDLHAQTGDQDLPDPVRLALFRIYQESLTNIAHHAGATRAMIEIYRHGTNVIMAITDNGHGFSVPEDWLDLARQGHLGLVGIQERAEAVGGSVDIASAIDEGTRIQVSVSLVRAGELVPLTRNERNRRPGR